MIYHLRVIFLTVAFLCYTFTVTDAGNLENTNGFCTCSIGYSECNCACKSIFSTDSLKTESFKFPRCKKFKFRLEHSTLPFLPHDLFSNIKQPTTLRFELNNSTVYLLAPHSEVHSPFQNILFSEVDISIEKSSTLAGWKWEVFQNLSATNGGLLSFNVVKSELLYLPDEFSKVAEGKISIIRILQCKLRWLGKKVFAPLSKLRVLELRNNLLETIERSQLPQPLSELSVLDLGNNRLSHIPHDLLEGLNLKTFFIDQNNILCLEPGILSRVQQPSTSGLTKMPVCKTNTTATRLEHKRN